MKVKIAILGYGKRGGIYAMYAKENPEEYEVTAVAEIDPQKRENAKRAHGCPVFEDWKEMLEAGIEADIIAVATQDSDHPEHAVECIKKGYDILLEKPIATTLEGCQQILDAAEQYGRKVIVCHVLRYTPFYCKVKEIIDSGLLGDIVTVSASENVGYYHQAHSFVRGPWRNSEESSPMILAKCCHDMDLLYWLIGKKCKKTASFGSLAYFKKENAPVGASTYCSACTVANCIYRAQDIYQQYTWMQGYFTQEKEWPAVCKALKGTQYDRCVFHTDNDVVDHQVSIFQFEDGITASHTMTAFSQEIYRDIKVHGTKAELVGLMEKNWLELRTFGGKIERIVINEAIGGHGGGDSGIMQEIYKIYNGETSANITYLQESIESHKMAFFAEKARVTGELIDLE